MKAIIYIIIIAICFSSCKHSNFLTRKYTAGRFVESKRTLRHNTVFSDTTINVTSMKNILSVKCNNSVTATEKDITDKKINSIFSKKDTIIHVKKRGPDKEIVVKSNSPDVHIFINSNKNNHKSIDTKKHEILEKEYVKNAELNNIKTTSTLAVIFGIIPIVGFIFSVKAFALIKRYKKANPTEKLIKEENKSSIGLIISIIPSLIVVAFLFLIFTALFLFTFSTTPIVPAI